MTEQYTEYQSNITQRDLLIIESVKHTRSLSVTSKKFKLTTERIRQIISISPMISIKKIRIEDNEKERKDFTERYNLFIGKFKKIPHRKEIGVNSNVTRRLYIEFSKSFKKIGLKREQEKLQIGIPKLLIELCNIGIRLKKTPTKKDVERFGKYGIMTYYDNFGSFSKAQKLAMFVPNKRGAQIGNTHWKK